MDEELTRAPELAEQLRVDAKRLRQAIRDHRLVLDHQRGKQYRLDAEDVARIRTHPSVRALTRH